MTGVSILFSSAKNAFIFCDCLSAVHEQELPLLLIMNQESILGPDFQEVGEEARN